MYYMSYVIPIWEQNKTNNNITRQNSSIKLPKKQIKGVDQFRPVDDQLK